ncbi:hypothetical protein ELE36_04165 [Pseudolysobacter antarcticus]|uniref:Glycosyltransferase RgtA/B/C/D-like domain-containing protein n=1 Tax=Pseudolysobacter antarcticus TaxID=2511995 RepID=A0A411HGR6_9GAMM|nr:hypothetical protein [Pseudolysobacter antarcticus]QBB69637.1 hypothetical protein ELE36_04165 [Pseudolysobacter antarcticus]
MKYFILISVLIILPSAINNGYYSHDELQWLALADTDSLLDIPWMSWLDFSVFQYRPLTFNFWLLLSHLFGYHPVIMHSVQGALGILNASLLRQCIIRFGAKPLHASVAAIAFLLVPFVVFAHSWIGTFADQLYLAWLLLALMWICRQPQASSQKWQRYMTPAVVAALTSLAVMTKEAAVVFPCLLLCAAYRKNVRDLLPSILASGLVVAIYLALRLSIILFSPRPPGVYTWAISNIPIRLFEYSIFPFVQNLNELAAFPWYSPSILGIAAIGTVLVLISITSAGLRWLLSASVLWFVALGPILILSTSSILYAYTASALMCGLFALAYPLIKPWAKGLLLLAGVAALLHSVDLVRDMRHVGRVQHHLYAALVPLLPDASTSEPLRIRADNPADEPILHHTTYAIPTYQRVPFSPRIRIVASTDTSVIPTHVMLHDGTLQSYPKHTQP